MNRVLESFTVSQSGILSPKPSVWYEVYTTNRETFDGFLPPFRMKKIIETMPEELRSSLRKQGVTTDESYDVPLFFAFLHETGNEAWQAFFRAVKRNGGKGLLDRFRLETSKVLEEKSGGMGRIGSPL